MTARRKPSVCAGLLQGCSLVTTPKAPPYGAVLMVIRVSPRFSALRCIIVDHTMNRLASILPAAQVLVSVDVTSKKRAFEEAGLLFESLHGLSRALITDSLFARERLGSTGLGHGVAIPHGRIKGLTAPWLQSSNWAPHRF